MANLIRPVAHIKSVTIKTSDHGTGNAQLENFINELYNNSDIEVISENYFMSTFKYYTTIMVVVKTIPSPIIENEEEEFEPILSEEEVVSDLK